MRSTLALVFGVTACAALAAAQAPGQPANVQAPQHPRYAEVTAKCRTPPPGTGGGPAGRRAGGGPPARGGAVAGRGAAPAAPGDADYTVEAIPGVIAAGARWTRVWQTTGNNADGPIASEDGGLLIAQNDNGTILKLDSRHQPSVAHRDTNTGGSLTRSPKGALFVASRGIDTAILQLEPQRRVHANRYQGDPLECLGGVLNDVTADGRGGVYFTMGGLYYADPKGMVTAYGTDLRTNGVILSPDERTLYVTNGLAIAAFDVQPDGALANQREFGKIPAGSGDGLAVDSSGRLYVTAGGGAGGAAGVHVFSADGRYLGIIAAPKPFITVAFSGPGKRTLYGIANNRQLSEVFTIPALAQGPGNRAK